MEQIQKADDESLYAVSAWVLRAGSLLSVALLLIGIALSLGRNSPSLHHSHRLLTAWQSLLRGEASGFVEAGLQMVTLTPVLTTVAICAHALIHRLRPLLLPSLLILGGLVLSVWIGIRQ